MGVNLADCLIINYTDRMLISYRRVREYRDWGPEASVSDQVYLRGLSALEKEYETERAIWESIVKDVIKQEKGAK